MVGHDWSSRPKSRIGRSTTLPTRSFISPAALFVNVSARIALAGMPSEIRWPTRRVMTRVLPDPAAATISSGPSTCVTAARWAGVRSDSRS